MDMTSRLLIALVIVGCVDATPHAVVHARTGMASLGGPVLVLPTRCVSALDARYCVPAAEVAGVGAPLPASYAALIDPSLRLKLEFAGYTLARGTSESAFVLDGSFEYLRGRGRFALGARIGLTLVDGQQHSWLVMPVTAMAYWGGAWGTVFAGVGYAPLATVSAVGLSTTYEHDGVEA